MLEKTLDIEGKQHSLYYDYAFMLRLYMIVPFNEATTDTAEIYRRNIFYLYHIWRLGGGGVELQRLQANVHLIRYRKTTQDQTRTNRIRSSGELPVSEHGEVSQQGDASGYFLDCEEPSLEECLTSD